MGPHAGGQTKRLPVELTSFVGRRAELRKVRAILESRRLVTLTGVGGVGKTRVALRIAAEFERKLDNRVWFVELAPVVNEELVVQAVARAMDVRESPGSPLLAAVLGLLREGPALLVVDNCEHLVDAAGRLVSMLMQACPQLIIIATSRELLRCEGETPVAIPPLSLPQRSADLKRAGVLRSESVQLFLDRAATAAGFTVDDGSVADVAAVCQRLDGLPLALELAAGMLRAVSPGELALRLDKSLRVLRTGSRTGPVRHESLQATIEWSYRLLSRTERCVFERLGVFAGGATLEGAEAVCADHELESADILPTLAALVDKSLVAAESLPNGRVRYRQLETVREYARARLVEHGDEVATLDRHADFFLALADAARPGTHPSFHMSALEPLVNDQDNLRVALLHLGNRHDERQLALTSALWLFWFVRGHYREGAAWVEQALEAHPDAAPATRAAALFALVEMLWPAGEVDRSVGLTEESLRLARVANDACYTVLSLRNLSILSMMGGQPAAAVPLAEESLALARTTGDRWLITSTRFILAGALELCGDDHAAETLYRAGVRDSRASNDDWLLTYHLANLSLVVARRGDLQGAEALARECLEAAWRLGDRRLCAHMLVILAVFAGRTRRLDRAARLLGAGDAQHERLAVVQERPPDGLADLRTRTSSGALAVSREKGRRLSLEAAIAEALQDSSDERRDSRPELATSLTRRELEIAALVAQGLSNLQIAQRLVITEGTTQNHLSHILNKLGLTSRTQIAAWHLREYEPQRQRAATSIPGAG